MSPRTHLRDPLRIQRRPTVPDKGMTYLVENIPAYQNYNLVRVCMGSCEFERHFLLKLLILMFCYHRYLHELVYFDLLLITLL